MRPPPARPLLVGGLVLVLLVALVVWMLRGGDTVAPGQRDVGGAEEPSHSRSLQTARLPSWYEAVGTVQARVSAHLASRIQGQVVEVAAQVGDRVAEGEVLVRLASAELQARLGQARQAVLAAEARAIAAEKAFLRAQELLAQDALAPQEHEAAEAAHDAARAQLHAAREQVAEAATVAGYRELVSPLAGIVRRRLVDPGDLAIPGQPLLVIQDGERLRLEADVREGILRHLRLGEDYPVRLQALDRTVVARLTERVPAADPRSRSFQVRLDLPADEDLYPGMFGSLRVPLEEREVVLVPAEAVRSVGQLDTVLVQHRLGERQVWQRRHVTLGATVDGQREVLSGLQAGEVVGW